MWSGGAPRRIAPCSSRSSWSRTRCWAMNSASRRGRTLASASRSASSAYAETSSPRSSRSSGPAQQPDRLLEQHRHRRGRRRRRSPPPRPPPGRPARPSSPARPAPGGPAPATPPPVTPGRAVGADRHRADPVAQLQHQPLGALLADARAPGSGSAVSALAMALRTASGVCTASTAWASRGPTPLAVCSSSNSCLASSSAKP